ncbi:MAG: lactate utilization protein [Proteobacteria bacterium]|nr:lactate utilization protein [Pseudomonadota bacterium]MBU1593924.1 lactate utilization protein [Pseudomonadota bacterium]
MSRQGILATLRAGLRQAPLDVPEAPTRPVSAPVGPGAWGLLAAALEPLDVRLRLAASPAEAAGHVADIARERQAATYARWQELPLGPEVDAALAGLGRVTNIGPDCCQALAQVDLGLTFAQAALLDSGSLALVSGPGRARAVSLLPPVHLCLVPRSALAPDVSALPELLRRHADAQGRPPSCLNLVTGPSSTADIELVLVRGVHGPRALEVVGLDWGI